MEIATIASALSCPARTVTGYDELTRVLDEVIPTLAAREEPLLLEVHIAREPKYRG